jgi:Lrp/AsnC family transcriptional regulator
MPLFFDVYGIVSQVMTDLDDIDRRILRLIQQDATYSMDQLAERVALSRNACWRRIKHLEDAGVITGRVALLDADALGCGLTALVLIRTNDHDAGWMDKFQKIVRSMPEITGAHRMTGDLDYVLRVRVADVPAYDRFYKRLIAQIPVSDISASFVMEDIKDTHALPV